MINWQIIKQALEELQSADPKSPEEVTETIQAVDNLQVILESIDWATLIHHFARTELTSDEETQGGRLIGVCLLTGTIPDFLANSPLFPILDQVVDAAVTAEKNQK